MSSKLKGGKKSDVTTVVTTPDVTTVVTTPDVTTVVTTIEGGSISKHDPEGSVMETSPMSLRLNMYQKDILEESAKREGCSQQKLVRKALLEYSFKNLGVQ